MEIALILKSPEFNQTVIQKTVIYADAGYLHASVIGDKEVLAVVGDFDSLGSAPKGQKIVELEVEKNYTDGERALRYAYEKGYDDITIYGAFGGKIEHVLGNIALLSIAKNLGITAKIIDNDTVVELIDGKSCLFLKKGEKVSLIPYGGECSFEYSKGLYYPLDNLTLTPSDTRGISNEASQDKVEIMISSGRALVIYNK